MRLRWIIALAAAAALAIGVGGAIATHVPQVDPATVPVGFLATHNDVVNFNVNSFARAARHHSADVFVQHARIPAGGSTPWHTHPGPVIVTVVGGSLTYQDAHGNNCQSVTYQAGEGFVDPGFGHVHRAIAGSGGPLDFYATYVLPSGSANHLILADPPPPCA
jgi:quercetin dioxygenase-like cupin family protein